MKSILVTGATRGLGLAIAERLVFDGFHVVGAGRHETEELSELRKRVGPDALEFEQVDLSDIGGVHEFASTLIRRHGPFFGLVNNAGVGHDGVLGTMHQADIEAVLTVNLRAPIYLTKYLSRSMLPRREGRIAFITSIAAATGFSGLSVYSATKAALEGFSRSLARELGRVGITANCVAPGFMETAMTQSLAGDKLDTVRRRAPLGLAGVADAAGAVSFLMGQDGRMVTGTVITVDGGSRA